MLSPINIRKGTRMNDFRGTNEVRIKRDELIEKLKENRDSHAQLYKDAMEGYFVDTEKKLTKKLAELKAGKVLSSISFSIPRDHTKEYDRLIKMLEMSQDVELVLSSHEFNQYVLDEWINDQEKTMLRAMALSSSNAGLYK